MSQGDTSEVTRRGSSDGEGIGEGGSLGWTDYKIKKESGLRRRKEHRYRRLQDLETRIEMPLMVRFWLRTAGPLRNQDKNRGFYFFCQEPKQDED